MVKAKPKGVKAKRGLWRLALGLGDPKLVGVGGGLVALLAIGIGANLMKVSGMPEAPPSMHEGRIASLTSRRNETPGFPEREPETLPAVEPQAAGVTPQAADVMPQLAAADASQRTGELANTHPDDGECMRWAAAGQCQSNPVFMLASSYVQRVSWLTRASPRLAKVGRGWPHLLYRCAASCTLSSDA